MGFGMHHGVRNASRGGHKRRGVCVDYTGRLTQPGGLLRLWRARPPSLRHCVGLLVLVCMLLQGKERARGGVGGGGGIRL